MTQLVAVQPGATATRVAAAGPEPRLLAEPAMPVAAALRLLFSDPPAVVLVGPADVAAALGTAVPRIVVDAGASGTDVTLVGPGGPGAYRRLDIGGARCDELVRGQLGDVAPDRARRVREQLSLLPTVTVQVADRSVTIDAATVRRALVEPLSEIAAAVVELARGRGVVEVVLAGGLARTPLLASLVDVALSAAVQDGPIRDGTVQDGRAGRPTVRVPAVPDTAGLLAVAARLTQGGPAGAATPTPWPRSTPPAAPLIPPPRRHRVRRVLVSMSMVAAAVALGLIIVRGAGPATGGPATGGPGSAGRAHAPPHAELSQYGYRFALPAGWLHSGGLPERRRTIVTPAATPAGGDLVSVERTDLGYDSRAEPARARAELRAVYEAAVRGGERLTGFAPDIRFAGREVSGYRQELAGGSVDWYVLLDGDAELSVGCRRTAAGAAAVDAACLVVVASLGRA